MTLAKVELKSRARELRASGMAYNQIAAELGVAKSSVSLWVRDLPQPDHHRSEAGRRRHAEAMARHLAEREREREAARNLAAAEIGPLSDREILLCGVVAYWCEGSKNKPGRRRYDRVDFINSDPALVGLFLRFLDVVGVDRSQLVFRVYIHENADIEAAQQFWLSFVGAAPTQFRRPVLKRHRPATKRTNVGEGYRGCLRVEVRCSTQLYRTIEGWARGILADPTGSQHSRGIKYPQLPGEDSNLG